MKSSLLNQHLDFLKLPYLGQHHVEFAQQAAERHWDHVDYLRRLIEGQYTERRQRLVDRRLKAARFPVLKTLEQYQWDWPKKINRLQVQNLFRLDFIQQRANVVFLGTVGVGTMPGTGLCRVG
jgi:DNA replication protein DnaC